MVEWLSKYERNATIRHSILRTEQVPMCNFFLKRMHDLYRRKVGIQEIVSFRNN